MTTIEPQSLGVGHYRLANVVGMEWVKLRSLRSTWLTLAVTVVGALGIALNVGHGTRNASGDLTNNVLAGIAPGLLLIGVLGVMVMTGAVQLRHDSADIGGGTQKASGTRSEGSGFRRGRDDPG